VFTYSSIQQYAQLVELKDYRPPTKKEYVRMVRRLADHFQCDPQTLTENQIREYFLFLRQHKKFARTAMSHCQPHSRRPQAPLHDISIDATVDANLFSLQHAFDACCFRLISIGRGR
jgi:hypothetical protein